MATNRLYERGRYLSLTPTDPSSPTSGDPVVVGSLPGVALTDARADGTATVQTDGVFTLPVLGESGGTGTAVSAGDTVYYSGGTISPDSAGTRFGYALEAVASGATSTIPVKIGH